MEQLKRESYVRCIKCCATWKVFEDKLYSQENALPNIHVHPGRLRIREDFETGNLEKFHCLLTGAQTASTGSQHGVQGQMEQYVKFYNPNPLTPANTQIKHILWV